MTTPPTRKETHLPLTILRNHDVDANNDEFIKYLAEGVPVVIRPNVSTAIRDSSKGSSSRMLIRGFL